MTFRVTKMGKPHDLPKRHSKQHRQNRLLTALNPHSKPFPRLGLEMSVDCLIIAFRVITVPFPLKPACRR